MCYFTNNAESSEEETDYPDTDMETDTSTTSTDTDPMVANLKASMKSLVAGSAATRRSLDRLNASFAILRSRTLAHHSCGRTAREPTLDLYKRLMGMRQTIKELNISVMDLENATTDLSRRLKALNQFREAQERRHRRIRRKMGLAQS